MNCVFFIQASKPIYQEGCSAQKGMVWSYSEGLVFYTQYLNGGAGNRKLEREIPYFFFHLKKKKNCEQRHWLL